MTIAETLEFEGCVYLALVDRKGEVILSEVQESDYWVGGDPGGWTNDSNVYFDTPEGVEGYYNRRYKQVYVFDDQYDAEEKCDELENAPA